LSKKRPERPDRRFEKRRRTKDGDKTVQDCIFCKIVRGEIPSKKVYEDGEILGFHDIHPVAPTHFMLIPKKHIATLADATADDAPVLGRIMVLTGRLARELGSPEGYRTIVNTGRIGRQDVMHVHVHVIGGPSQLGAMIVRSTT
jgi:histidine triad (HIT) family protein